MTTPSTSAQGPDPRRIADLIDENAECYSENAMDRAFLGNSEELAALVVEYLALTASPSPAASPASPSGVRVKPLEWLSHAWGAEADGGRYRIEDNGANWTDDRYWLFVNVGLLSNHRSKFATLDEAKAAAQADYEARILSALASDATPAPTSGSEDRDRYKAAVDRVNRATDADIGGIDRRLVKPASEPAGGDVDANGVDMTAVEGALGAAKKAGIVVSFNDVWAIVTLYRAALSSSAAPAEPVFPAYGKMSFDELGRAVKAAQFGEPEPYEFDPEFYPGHQMVGPINFNSLNRIVTWFAERAAHPAPATVEMREALPGPAKQLDRIRIGEGEYVRADEAVKTVMELQRQLYDADRRLAALAPATEGRKS